MKIEKAYKTEIKVNNKQRSLLYKCAGTARFAYNWGLGIRKEEYEETGKSLNAMDLHKRLTKLKKTEFSWMYDVSKCCAQAALQDLDDAFSHFFRRLKLHKQGKCSKEELGFPRFKNKKRSKNSNNFYLYQDIHIEKDRIKLPKLPWLRLKEKNYVPTDKKINSVTVSQRSNKWFVSVQISEEKDTVKNSTGKVIASDLGIKELATTSEGKKYHNPKAMYRYEKKLKRTQRKFDRMQKGSNNREKMRHKLRKVHYRISCIRGDASHKFTTSLAKTKLETAVIEDLAVKNMMKNHCLAKAISDANFGEIRRQLGYKSLWYGFELFVVPRFFPSSKTCSSCGYIKKDLKLSERIFKCPICGLEIDRDFNASLNLKNYYLKQKNTAGSAGINACRDGKLQDSNIRCPSEKQEVNSCPV